jgi:hypothetical protein
MTADVEEDEEIFIDYGYLSRSLDNSDVVFVRVLGCMYTHSFYLYVVGGATLTRTTLTTP